MNVAVHGFFPNCGIHGGVPSLQNQTFGISCALSKNEKSAKYCTSYSTRFPKSPNSKFGLLGQNSTPSPHLSFLGKIGAVRFVVLAKFDTLRPKLGSVSAPIFLPTNRVKL
jgi:hypothetical protein